MENELVINGVTYVKKDSIKENKYEELRDNINQRLTLVNQEINDMIDNYINDEVIKPMITEKNTTVVDDEQLIDIIFPSARKLYENVIIYDDGSIKVSGVAVKYNMSDIQNIAKAIKNKALKTGDDMALLAHRLHMSLGHVHKIVYNVIKGTFDGHTPVESKSKKGYKKHKSTDIFVPFASTQSKYEHLSMDEDGTIHSKYGGFNLTIHQIIQIKIRAVDKEITFARANQIASDFGLSVSTFSKIVYNIQVGTFNDFIEQWTAKINETPIGKMPIKVQNNPEKRREQGYYGGVGGY